MSEKPKVEQIGISNLSTLKDILVSCGKLQAPIDPSYVKRMGHFQPPVERIVFIDQNRTVGYGIVNHAWDHHEDHSGEHVLMFDIELVKTYSQPLTTVHQAALGAYLKQYDIRQHELTGILPIGTVMNSLFPAPIVSTPVLLGEHSESWLREERKSILESESICMEEKLLLLQALDGCGEHADSVEALHTIRCGECDQDFESHPIVPWESCTPAERLDPHNWILLPSAMVGIFRMGLYSFADNGAGIRSDALLSDLHSFSIHYDYRLYSLTERQRQYLKIHREEIFDSWRVNPPWLS